MKVKKQIKPKERDFLPTVEEFKDLKNPFQCPTCDRVLASKDSLKQHFQRAHTSYEKAFKCKKCDKAFYTTSDRKKHKRSHKPLEQRKKYICEDCFMVYHTKRTLKVHRSQTCEERLIIEEFNCNACDLKFITKSYLKRHVEEVHEGRRRRTCEICLRGFRSIYQVRKHSERVHSMVTDYPCPNCTETYYSCIGSLKFHLTVYHSKDFIQLGHEEKKN